VLVELEPGGVRISIEQHPLVVAEWQRAAHPRAARLRREDGDSDRSSLRLAQQRRAMVGWKRSFVSSSATRFGATPISMNQGTIEVRALAFW
jgi:hypothetical protein